MSDPALNALYGLLRLPLLLTAIIIGALMIKKIRKVPRENRTQTDNTELLIGVILVIKGVLG